MSKTFWEIVAVLFSIAYTLLISYGLVWCWPFAIGASVIFMALCFGKRIYAEMSLHTFYLVIGIYGWMHWSEGLSNAPAELSINTHVSAITLCGLATFLSGFLLGKYTNNAISYVDSFTTIFSVWATYLMVSLYTSNWLYFIVIDLVSIYLYYSRKMYFTAVLFIVYTALAVNGWLQWTT